jgi:hypothetical protein
MVIFLTRLPVGHTHDDIDAAFAEISKAFRNKPCLCPQDFKETVIAALQHSNTLKVRFVEVALVPNYCEFLSAHIDPSLSRLHKEEYTQHQWKFVACEKSQNFPFGVISSYRAYASEIVVELKMKNKAECLTPIGRWTGLESQTVRCHWYPQPNQTRDCYGW